jgi:membrane protease YdiL (CAAX protease family)
MISSFQALSKRYAFVLFVFLSVLISWFPWYTTGSGFLVFGPSLAGVMVIALTLGKEGMQDLGQRFLKWRVGLSWWLVALGLSAVLLLIALAINLMFGGTVPSFAFFRSGWYMAPIYFALTLIGGPMGEEFGWRGFALPHLQGKWGPATASIILGTVWGLWHLPLFLQSGTLHAQLGLQLLPVYVLGEIALATLMTWVYNKTGGSLLVAGIIMHNADNFWASTLLTDETFASAFQGGTQTELNLQIYLIATIVSLLAALVVYRITNGTLGFRNPSIK